MLGWLSLESYGTPLTASLLAAQHTAACWASRTAALAAAAFGGGTCLCVSEGGGSAQSRPPHEVRHLANRHVKPQRLHA